jgi:ferric-dicitrate binding protein FerR (iron transport regulator)
MDTKLIKKFLANECSADEVDAFFIWIQDFKNEQSKKSLIKTYWDELETFVKEDDIQDIQRLDRIHHTINLNQSERLINRNEFSYSEGKSSIFKLISKIAAFILLPVLTLVIYTQMFQPKFNVGYHVPHELETTSPPGSRTYFELNDGTKVWLNHGSRLVYPQTFAGNTRTVKLTGEGYFEVSENKEKPFIVELGKLAVKAVGTAFNIKAYPDDSDLETSLESGKVIILDNTPEKKSEVCKMEPGQHFVFNNNSNRYTLKSEDLSKYVSWKDGKLIFKDDHLDKVAEELSRWYNITITLNDTTLRSLTYTATFVNETLYQVLEMLKVVTPISYSAPERQIKPDGTFSKQEIIIFKKEREEKSN